VHAARAGEPRGLTAKETPSLTNDCEAILRENRDVLSHPSVNLALCEQGQEYPREHLMARNDLFDYCHAGHGTWVVQIVDAKLTSSVDEGPQCGAVVRYRLLFFSPQHEKSVSTDRAWAMFVDGLTQLASTATASWTRMAMAGLTSSTRRSFARKAGAWARTNRFAPAFRFSCTPSRTASSR